MEYLSMTLLKLQNLILTQTRHLAPKRPPGFRESCLVGRICVVFLNYDSAAETGLLTGSFGNSYQLINNSNGILYRADGSSSFQRNLYVKAVRGGADLKLSDELGPDGDVASFQVSADQSTVVYAGKKSSSGIIELYKVAVEGGPAVKLNISFTAPRKITSYKITPDNSHVIYSLQEEDLLSIQLYKVSIDGGMSLPLGSASEAIRIGYITPDSAYMVFAGGSFGSDLYSNNLFRVNLTDGSVVQLNDDFVVDGTVDFPDFSPDGQTVVYEAFTSPLTVQQGIFSVQIAGGDPVKLNPAFVAGGSLSHKFIGPLGQFVYYVADQTVDDQYRLFRVPIGGGTSEELIDNFMAGESLSRLRSTRVSADGSHAVFEVDGTDPSRDLYSLPLQTGLAVKLNSGGRVLKFRISNDGGYVIFDDDSETTEVFELYSIPISGGIATKINSDYESFANTTSGINYDISPDSKRVAYWIDIEGDFKREILEVPIGGGTSKRLSPELPGGSDVGFPRYSDDGSLVLFSIEEFKGVFFGVFAFDFKDVGSELCFPVIVEAGSAAIICL